MPRYFFNLASERSLESDLIGTELADDERAKSEARRIASDLAAADALEGRSPAFEWIEVLDEHQRPVARLPVEAVREPNRSV